MQFSTLNGDIPRLRDIELKVMEGGKNLSKNQLNTGMDGTLNVSFEMPEAKNATSSAPLTLQAKDVSKGVIRPPVLTIPVLLNRAESTDVQFMPEGGNMVAGIATKVGFKAIGEDGKGIRVNGKILDSKQQKVATFSSAHAGMGSFEFIPRANEQYMAKVEGVNKTYALPAVNLTGTVLNIKPTASNDSVVVVITANTGLAGQIQTYYLIGRARG